MSRKYTNKILEQVEDGWFNNEQLIRDLLMWMSEDDVAEFYDRFVGDIDEEMEDDE